MMSTFENAGASIDFSVHGDGYPLALFAPGGMNSIAQLWRERPEAPGQSMPWIDPTTALSDLFQVIAMDQRNAGHSSAPVTADDGWTSYSGDQIALLDHLGVGSTHLMGGCIGSSYCLGFIKDAPGRAMAAVLQNPIGISDDNRDAFYELFDGWAAQLQADRSDVTDEALAAFRSNMFDGDFVFSVDRDFVANCEVPLLILPGNDQFHPGAIAEEIASLAPSARLVPDWSGPTRSVETRGLIADFLSSHTPRVT